MGGGIVQGTSSPAVLLLADADDIGVARLAAQLPAELSVVWWRFGLPESSVSVDVDQHDFHLEQPGACLRSSDFRSARLIVHKRRVHQPRPLVASELSCVEDHDFSEREWTSLIEGLLLAEEQRCGAVWLNPPSTVLSTANKMSLMMRASRAGLPVPSFRVSTPVKLPAPRPDGLVTKAVSTDERIDATRYLSTTLVPADMLDAVAGCRTPTPCLLQQYIPPAYELRVFYVLGQVFTLALTPSAEHVDIRHLAAADMQPRAHELPRELAVALSDFTRLVGLNYCTFDLLVPHDGPVALVDITPNGAWDYFESASAPTLTQLMAATIETHVNGVPRPA
jgi:hypothetical protein